MCSARYWAFAPGTGSRGRTKFSLELIKSCVAFLRAGHAAGEVRMKVHSGSLDAGEITVYGVWGDAERA